MKRIKTLADRLEPKDTTIDEYEKFLEKYGKILHPNHVILLDVKYTLAKMYGRSPGYEADGLTEKQFERKKQLADNVLDVLNKILPGRSRKRGMAEIPNPVVKTQYHPSIKLLGTKNLISMSLS